MSLRLRVIPPGSDHSGGSPDAVAFDDGAAQVRIGRRAGLELSLPFQSLSGVHARLVRATDGAQKSEHWLLEDLGSTNGTFVDGERLKPGFKRPVKPGMQIKLAGIQLVIEGDAADKASGEVAHAVPNNLSSKTEIVKDTGKVQSEASLKDTGKISGKVQSEVSAKDTGKVTGKIRSEIATKETGKVQREASASVSAAIPPRGNEPTETYVRRQMTDIAAAAPVPAQVPYLTVVAGLTDGPKLFRLEQRDHAYLFGRTRRCEFRVDTAEVSREHASFERRAEGVFVNDMGSVNGVLVNNTRVKEYRLFDGDLIQIGHIKLRLFDPTVPSGRDKERSTGGALSRVTPSHSVPSHSPLSHSSSAIAHSTPSHSAPRAVAPEPRRYEPPPPGRPEPPAVAAADVHPLVAGFVEAENPRAREYGRRPSVRVRIAETWESSSKFRYAIVIVAASLLAVCAVIVGFTLAG
jgi:pSer/pThr/pTyr-binding forkhead associated (FHA) protein